MKLLWTAISIVALLNLLAIAGAVGWLVSSDRLDKSRLREVRELFTETLSAKHKRLEDDKAKAEQAEKDKALAVKAAKPPMTAAEMLAVSLEASEAQTQRRKSNEAQITALGQTLREQKAELEKAKAELAGKQAAFDKMRADIKEREGTAQFKKTLSTLQGLDAKSARSILQEVLSTGKNGEGFDTTVGYLNAMEESKRTEVMQEFTKADPKLAAQLLERLRSYGLSARPPEDAPR